MTSVAEPATQTSTIPSSTLPVTPHADRIALTGFMGAGKSTVGRLLAQRLHWGFVDVDGEVEEARGCSIATIFEQEGEEAFRRYESSALARSLGRQHTVVALGGGAPERLTNRLLLEQTPRTAVVFLNAPFSVLFDRCVLQEGAAVRPVLMDAEAAAERFRLRVPFYRRCAHHHLLTEGRSPQETANAILALLTAS